MQTNSNQSEGLSSPAKSKYPLWFWIFVAFLVLSFVAVLLTDPYYKQVPLWGIE